MKKLATTLLICGITVVLLFTVSFRNDIKLLYDNILDKVEKTDSIEISEKDENSGTEGVEKEDEDESVAGPELERKFFARWHEPHGNMLEQEIMENIQSQIKKIPDETEMQNLPVNSWRYIGPYGMNVTYQSGGMRYSGRILDIEQPENGASIRIAGASGGIWQFAGYPLAFIVGIMNNTNTQSSSTFVTKPGDKNTIFVGTGEESQRTGTGLWKTSNGGTNWTNIPMSPTPNAINRIRYTPGSTTVMHAATDVGYFQSTDGGSSWSRKFVGNITDLSINPTYTNDYYIAKWGDTLTGGIYATNNAGQSWYKISTTGIPTANVGRSAITECASQPYVLYVLITRNDNNAPMGVYKTINWGTTWTNVSPSLTSLGGNGWYNAVIGVNPTDPNRVLAGMTNLMITGNGGNSWSQITDPHVHADVHAITWASNGTTVYCGNDGGLSTSTNDGVTWSNTSNNFGITQYYHCSVGIMNNQMVSGGSQDNGLSFTTNAGASGWSNSLAGDGGGTAYDPTNTTRIFGVTGAYGGSIKFRRQVSNNGGQSWSDFNSGISADSNWTPEIRTDRLAPFNVYTNANSFVYYSQSPYNTWTKLNTVSFPDLVSNVTVSNSGVVFACLAHGLSGAQLRVYESGTWYERSSGLPAYIPVRTVVHRTTGFYPFFTNHSYAIMNGLYSPGQKIFTSTNFGQTWTNITGDLPNLPIADVVVNPTDANYLYLGTEFGCYKTTNGGANWMKWNNGMPDANIITEMGYIDSLSSSNKFFVVASSFGRGIWIRDISGDDPMTGIENNNNKEPKRFVLEQNFPNPFNPTTNIKFNIPKASHVTLGVYDITGKLVEILVDKDMAASSYEIVWNANKYSSGVYFYRIDAGDFKDVKRMILVK
jgi:photosystem II stability/assembly factor-like uncharacterized protein